ASSIVSLLDWASQNPGFTVVPFKSDAWPAEYSAAAFRKEDQTLRAVFNGLMIAMKEDGTLAELQLKWFGQSFSLPNDPPVWAE
ncbi:MAG: transporter substrate-binding domain-containing protein, partial [Caldilinea sp.]